MIRKFVLYLFHEKQLCKNSCSQKYPWGWKSRNCIIDYKQIINNNYDNNVKKINENHFLKNSIISYNKIYKTYLNEKDFLDFEFTTPKLSIALNNLRENSNNDIISKLPKEINVNKSIILSNSINNELTTNNFKFLGYYNKDEIVHQIITGAIGPEIRHLWDQLPSKQIINVLYQSDNYYDIIEWERNLLESNSEWQVSNINKII